MHNSFRCGFEKISYDYAHESKAMAKERLARSTDTPMSYGKAIGFGALGGGALGGIMGGVSRGGMGALAGMGIGALAGGLLGAGVAAADESDIEDAKYVAQMDPTERAELTASRARKHEKNTDRAHDRMIHGYPYGYPYGRTVVYL